MKLQKNPSFSLLSPAKINYFFLILGKRSDNFHEIASLFQAINLFDKLTFELAESDQFTCNIKSLERASNSVTSALALFREEFHIDCKIKIHLEKSIPIQAGLGGGSSNAATTLWALNKLFRAGKDESKLIKLAERLGSDVPFFFSKGSAMCRGRGEIVENVDIPLIQGWILQPSFGVCTKSVYANIRSIQQKNEYETLLNEFQKGNFCFINDLFAHAAEVQPKIEDIKRLYPFAQITGSGSCFFTLEKPIKTNQIKNIYPFSGISRKHLSWYSINL